MFENNAICKMLEIKYPIFQGGMAWAATAELAAAVSNAGGLGIIGSGQMTPEILKAEIHKAKKLTDKPFGVNVMLMQPHVKGIMQLLADERVAVVTTGAGNPGEYIAMFKTVSTKVIPVVPSVALAKRLERLGVDAVIVEGTESGGHVGELTTICLVPQITDAINIPVIAAGGIADGRGMLAAFALGAQGIQMGTRFVASLECTAHDNYKQSIIKAKDRSTVTTGLSSGHPVRIIDNAMAREYSAMEKRGADEAEMEAFGAGKLRLAVRDGDVKNGSVMAGQISGMIDCIKSVEDILKDITAEFGKAINKLETLKN